MKSPSESVHTQLSQAVGSNNDNLGRVYNARKQLEAKKINATNKDVAKNTGLNNGVVSRAFVQLDAIFYGNISKKPWAADLIISKCKSIIERNKDTLPEDAVEWLNYVISTAKTQGSITKHSEIEEDKIQQLANNHKDAVNKTVKTPISIGKIFDRLSENTTLASILRKKGKELTKVKGSVSLTIEDEIEAVEEMETVRRTLGSLETMAGISNQGYIELLKNHKDWKVGKTADAIKVDENGAIVHLIALTTSDNTKNHDGKNGMNELLGLANFYEKTQKGLRPLIYSLVYKSYDPLTPNERTGIICGGYDAYCAQETGDPYWLDKVQDKVRKLRNEDDIYDILEQYHEEGLRRAFPVYKEWVKRNRDERNPYEYNKTIHDFLKCLGRGDNCLYCQDGKHKVSAKALVTCRGETKKGEKCNNMIVHGEFCGVHTRTT